LKVLNCGAGEGWRRSVGPLHEKLGNITYSYLSASYKMKEG